MALIAGQEVPFVRKWASQIRSALSPALRQCSILIRPHPQNAEQWQQADLSDLEQVAVWPRGSVNRLDPSAKSNFFDSLFHSSGVVGINTSALIEAAIVGRPVYTILAPEYRDTQEALPQFKHLTEVAGGLLQVAETFEQHHEQLSDLLAGRGPGADRIDAFLEVFIRPRGRAVPATPIVADVVERLAAQPTTASTPALWTYPLRLLLLPVAYAMNRAWGVVKEHQPRSATGTGAQAYSSVVRR